jgi:heptosyltransferase I
VPVLDTPPRRLCLIRLSALGDVTHALPIIHTLRAAWPQTELTWIIGGREAEMVKGLEGVELLALDKATGFAGYRALARTLKGRRFDLLLLMQVSIRAHLASLAVKAPLRLGFDPVRSRDLHRLFVNRRIPFTDRQHVLDGYFEFLEALGIERRVMDWSVPIPDADREFAEAVLPGDTPTLLISPGASKALRNWPAEDYAAIADIAARRHGMRVVLSGGPSAVERQLGDAIARGMQTTEPLNLIGQLTIKRALAVMARSTVLISPDSGPAHMAAITDTPVIGLYAVSNPQRTGPYKSIPYCVDGYQIATRKYLGQPPEALPWGRRVEHRDAMRCISREAVAERLAAVMRDIGVSAGAAVSVADTPPKSLP